jgi:hypothetical protein
MRGDDAPNQMPRYGPVRVVEVGPFKTAISTSYDDISAGRSRAAPTRPQERLPDGSSSRPRRRPKRVGRRDKSLETARIQQGPLGLEHKALAGRPRACQQSCRPGLMAAYAAEFSIVDNAARGAVTGGGSG